MDPSSKVTVGLLGNTQLCVDGYLYSKRTSYKTKTFWCCAYRRKFKCGGAVTTEKDYPFSNPYKMKAHSHPPNEATKEAIELRKQLRGMGHNKKLLRATLRNTPEDVLKLLPDYQTIVRDLRRQKKSLADGGGAGPSRRQPSTGGNKQKGKKRKKTPDETESEALQDNIGSPQGSEVNPFDAIEIVEPILKEEDVETKVSHEIENYPSLQDAVEQDGGDFETVYCDPGPIQEVNEDCQSSQDVLPGSSGFETVYCNPPPIKMECQDIEEPTTRSVALAPVFPEINLRVKEEPWEMSDGGAQWDIGEVPQNWPSSAVGCPQGCLKPSVSTGLAPLPSAVPSSSSGPVVVTTTFTTTSTTLIVTTVPSATPFSSVPQLSSTIPPFSSPPACKLQSAFEGPLTKISTMVSSYIGQPSTSYQATDLLHSTLNGSTEPPSNPVLSPLCVPSPNLFPVQPPIFKACPPVSNKGSSTKISITSGVSESHFAEAGSDQVTCRQDAPPKKKNTKSSSVRALAPLVQGHTTLFLPSQKQNKGATHSATKIFHPTDHTLDELLPCATDNSEMFSISLARFPQSQRIPIKKKLINVVDCVKQNNISADNILIAYYDAHSDSRMV